VEKMVFKINNNSPEKLEQDKFPEECYKLEEGYVFIPTTNGKPYRVAENGQTLITDVFSPYTAVSLYDKKNKKGAIGLTNDSNQKRYQPEKIIDTLLKELSPESYSDLEASIACCSEIVESDKNNPVKTLSNILDKYNIKKIGIDNKELPVGFYARMMKMDSNGNVDVYRISL
jgi:hypothetical protein